MGTGNEIRCLSNGDLELRSLLKARTTSLHPEWKDRLENKKSVHRHKDTAKNLCWIIKPPTWTFCRFTVFIYTTHVIQETTGLESKIISKPVLFLAEAIVNCTIRTLHKTQVREILAHNTPLKRLQSKITKQSETTLWARVSRHHKQKD